VRVPDRASTFEVPASGAKTLRPASGATRSTAIMRDLIKLTCQTCKRDNYVTDKNKRTQTEKFEIKKFCKACRCHTQHKEGKISKG
jgi:large subunit ribosomal protein L33